MLSETRCPVHGFQYVSTPRDLDPDEAKLDKTLNPLGVTTFKCPIRSCYQLERRFVGMYDGESHLLHPSISSVELMQREEMRQLNSDTGEVEP